MGNQLRAPRKQLSVVVVTYYSMTSARGELLAICDSIAGRRDVELIIVDNSGGCDAEKLKAERPMLSGIRILPMDNVGFAAGCNMGSAASTAPWLLFLNPDVYMTNSALDRVLEAATETSHQVLALGLTTGNKTFVGIEDSLFGWFRDRPRGSRKRIMGPSGGGALIRSDVFEATGGFNEQLFAWGEDAELAYRLRRLGIECGQIPVALAHSSGHSVKGSKTGRRFKAELLSRNRQLIAKKHMTAVRYLVFTAQHALVLAALTGRNIRRGTVVASWRGFMKGLRDTVHHAM